MAKFCTNCGNQLDDNAAMCLNCGYVVGGSNTSNNSSLNSNGNVKKKGLPTWAIVLIVVGCVLLVPLIIFIAIFVFAFKSTNNIIDDVKDKLNNVMESEEIIGTIDDTLENDDIRITLKDALMYSSIGDGSFTNTPAEGKEYLVFFFDVENLSSQTIYLSSYSFDGYVDGYSVNSKTIYGDIDGYSDISSTIAAGKKIKGYVVYEVDTAWENFEVSYREVDLDFEDVDDTFIFKVINSEDDNTGV